MTHHHHLHCAGENSRNTHTNHLSLVSYVPTFLVRTVQMEERWTVITTRTLAHVRRPCINPAIFSLSLLSSSSWFYSRCCCSCWRVVFLVSTPLVSFYPLVPRLQPIYLTTNFKKIWSRSFRKKFFLSACPMPKNDKLSSIWRYLPLYLQMKIIIVKEMTSFFSMLNKFGLEGRLYNEIHRRIMPQCNFRASGEY